MSKYLRSNFLRIAITLIAVGVLLLMNLLGDIGSAIFLAPVIFVATYIWLGVVFFFFDLVWIALTKPEERLFAVNMLNSFLLVAVFIAAGYWLIADSIGLWGTIIYAFGAYFVFSIVRWFRRHTASYYAALEAGQNGPDEKEQNSAHKDQE